MCITLYSVGLDLWQIQCHLPHGSSGRYAIRRKPNHWVEVLLWSYVMQHGAVHFGLLESILLPYHDDTSHKYNNPHTNMAISVTHIDIGADRSIDRSIKRVVGLRLLSLLKSTSDRQWQRKKHMHYHRKRTKQIYIRGINRMAVVDSVSLLFLFGWCGFGIPIGRHQKHSMNPSE